MHFTLHEPHSDLNFTMGSIGQPASSPMAQSPSMGMATPSQPQLQHQFQPQQSTPSNFPSLPALPVFTPFGQPSFSACGLQSAGITATPGSKRKRSRDDEDESEEEYFPKLAAPSIEDDEWEYGEGMTLRRKGAPRQHVEAGSGTGTWAEEQLEKSRFPSPPRTIEKPIIRNHKSQRLNLNTDSAGVSSAPNSSPTHQSPMRQQGPLIDSFTLHLGIGWSKISDDGDMQAAARGWAKYIENHFPVTSPQIRLQSRALESYLVEAKEGWFLFGEDLKQGRFVAPNVERAFEHLRSNPPTFDGVQTLEAVAQSPNTSLTEVDSEAEEYGDEPHCYEASMAKRKAFLSSLGEGAGESLKGVDAQIGQVPELVGDDAMDMS